MDKREAIKNAYRILETGDYPAFLARIDELIGSFNDPATVRFLASVRLKFFRGVNSLFDDLDDFLGRDFSSLIPSRRDQFDAHAGISGLGYGTKYHEQAMRYVEIHKAHSGLRPNSRVLELGCGAGNFAYALSNFLESGCYYGVDTSAMNIASCAARFATLPHYKFNHISAALDGYHMLLEQRCDLAAAKVADVRLPLLEDFYSLQVSHSVFTHMYTEEVRHYLKEVRRSLAPGGITANTCFIIDPFSRAQIYAGKATHNFIYEKDGFHWYWQHDPLMGNAFSLELLLSMYEEAGLQATFFQPLPTFFLL